MFTDEVDKRRHNEAIQKCGSNASKACIADYLATGDIALAEVSGQKEHDSKSDIATIGIIICFLYSDDSKNTKNLLQRMFKIFRMLF